MPEGYDRNAAVGHLRDADHDLRAHIDTVGPCTLTPAPDVGPHTLFDRLASSILSQQLSVKAAATIAGRLRERAADPPPAAGGRAPLVPGRVSALSDEELRACGISRPKIAALRDLSDAVGTGRIPTLTELTRLDDDEVVASLTAVRGVGRWTAEMLLIFLLDRPDVFPVADVGVRRGFEQVLGLDQTATVEQMLARSESWAPYRSVASWYLWRAVDQSGQAVPAPTTPGVR
ncbi:DNA-3-methyladenine glycosylase [Dietzia sp. PP-33]|jgi:DNA-3-methyladenine glycosylase II|uniref:DNA-3-methyladenine glycosylase family protein n=1 Tax=Dietzia sp. PP-33 TaxID=2957500 RepID=UPI0029ACCE5C|nr:DNA-3-methyladenine glycosylase [Dietzia sp. PP-33]MDX2356442.1 DNA-3-methyladenine glycosylase [Dietzia sp. PP-33]